MDAAESRHIKRGHIAALRILLPALPFELATAALGTLWLTGSSELTAVGALITHLFAPAAVWSFTPKRREDANPHQKARIEADRHIHALTAVVVFFFPVLGLAGMGYVLAAQQASHRQGLVEVLGSEMKRAAKVLGVERVEDVNSFLLEESSVEPILEILKGGDVGLKRGAVSLLGKIGGREAVALLKESLSDQSPEVRFYAHATLAKLDDSYTQAIKADEREAASGEAQALAVLGDAFVRYAESGLVEDVVRRQLLERATDAYEKALTADPGDGRLHVTLGYLLLSRGLAAKARAVFLAAPEGPSRVEALLGLCEIAFETRDYKALHSLRLDLASVDFKSTDPRKLVMFQFWTQTGDMA
ncbi:hypothetical protein NNJEOMEG_02982 [Fundidesulfovibrio magnetotacticus]|uniref:HEAT repeat domain-containing protein n=1 Tax=Fundidesulfovibrio magnetotacticus TaxID=2730080 RepID=A0A6V8LTS2_9BACT|nr:HEAT repeat domain-containing protein [Fundidesulfovibrio magnetotacticus]GFK95124.1 hypothetical protein NNJEOMEG_02982 [Fundidesulfovibrio magnetotacticus]